MISIKELFNDYNEVHAFVLGLADGFLFWRKWKYTPELKTLLNSELWYYRSGMILGVFLWLLVALFQVGIFWLVKLIIF